ncbi:MAG: S8 family serine peptidase [Alphaproteobacteria bacterium]|nr:S8 family serine peptidase [Alphaproteobacteria bacterium]
MTHSLLRFILLLAGSLFLASCSGSSGGGPTSVPTIVSPPAPAPQTNYDTAEYRHSYGLAQMKALAAYDKGATGAGVTVAVIDTGIDVDNPQLKANIRADSTNIITGSKANLNDTDGHGTGVAGVIAAIRDPSNTNRNNMQGVAFDAKILAINAASAGSCASTTGCSFFDSDIAAALDYARVQGVKIVNISLGGKGYNSPLLVAAYKRAVAAGMIIIQAAGNREKGQTDLQIAQPEDSASVAWASWANGQIIIAGAVDKAAVIGTFSRRAGTIAKNVYLVAAGDKVLSLGVDKSGNAAYFNWSGTSFSTPHIAGAAALLMGAFPNLTGKQVADLLLSTATDLGAAGADVIYGRGLVNLKAAFAPKGTTSIAVEAAGGGITSVAMNSSVILGGKAFGGFSGFSAALDNSMMLDGYNRSYRVNLGRQIFNPRATVDLGSMIGAGRYHSTSLRLDRSARLRLSWTEDLRFKQVDELYFSNQENSRNRYRNLRMKLSLAVGAGQNMTFAQGLSLKEAMEDYDQDEFLTIGRGDFMALIGRRNNQSVVFDQKLDRRTGFSLAVAHGSQKWQQYRLRSDSFIMMARLDHDLSATIRVGLDLGLMTEKGSVLGSLSNGALSLGTGATTAFANARINWNIAGNIRFFTKASYGRTAVTATNSSLVQRISGLTAASFSAGLTGNSLFQRGDRLSFAVSQPLRVIGGHADIAYVTARNYRTDSLAFISNRVALAPNGREIDVELAYTIANIFGARVDFNVLHQINPDHNRLIPANTAVLIRFGSEF